MILKSIKFLAKPEIIFEIVRMNVRMVSIKIH